MCHFAVSIWSIVELGSTLYLSYSIVNIFANWLNEENLDSKYLLGWERLSLLDRSGYVETRRFLTIKQCVGVLCTEDPACRQNHVLPRVLDEREGK
jgi:hypothetical protein